MPWGALVGAVAAPVVNSILGNGGGSSQPQQTQQTQSNGAGQAVQTALTGAYGAGQISNAGNAITNSINQGIGTQQNLGSQIQSTYAPYTGVGATAIGNLAKGAGNVAPGSLQASGGPGFNMATAANNPAYNFALQQGLGAINNQADVTGTSMSSANLANLGQYATGLASQTENQAFNQYVQQQNLNNSAAAQNASLLGGIANTGLNAAGGVASGLTNTGNSITNLQTAQGTNNANSILGQANALAGASNSAGNALAQSGLGSAIGGLVNTGINQISGLFGLGSNSSPVYSGPTSGVNMPVDTTATTGGTNWSSQPVINDWSGFTGY